FVSLAGNGSAQIIASRADRLAGRRIAYFLEIFEVAMGMPGLAFRGRAEHCRHVVVAFDVCLLGEIEIAAVGLALAGECRFEVLLGPGIPQCRHPSLHRNCDRPLRCGSSRSPGYRWATGGFNRLE